MNYRSSEGSPVAVDASSDRPPDLVMAGPCRVRSYPGERVATDPLKSES